MSIQSLLVGAFVLWPQAARSAPTISFPVNSQVPPLALANAPYNFQFSAGTFTSASSGKLSYALQDAPPWLVLDSQSRTLSGTPTDQDEGSATFGLLATDDTGSTTQQVTLVVDSSPTPQPSVNVSQVLATAGALNDNASVTLHTGSTFSIAFPSNTFGNATDLSYYAISANRTPLPSWIHFNVEALTLSGTTPPPVPNPMTIGLLLIASSIAGFAATSISFELVISDHQLAFDQIQQTVSVSPGQQVSVLDLRSELRLDGQPIPNQDIATAVVQAPTWLQFDEQSFALSGTVPQGVTSTDVRILASDIYGDNANTYIHLKGGSAGSSQSSDTSPIARGTSSSASPENTSTTAESQSPSHRSSGLGGGAIAALVLAILLFLGIVAFIFFLCRRRHLRRGIHPDEKFDGRKSGQMANVRSKYIPKHLTSGNRDPEKGFAPGAIATTQGPSIGQDAEGSHSDGVELAPHEQAIWDSFKQSSSGQGFGYGKKVRSSVAFASGALRDPYRSSLSRSRTSRISRYSAVRDSWGTDRRFAGIGHGRATWTALPSLPPADLDSIKKRRRCTHCGSHSVISDSTSTESLYRRPRIRAMVKKGSIRAVPAVAEEDLSSEISEEDLRDLPDNRPFEEKRQSWVRQRALSTTPRSMFPVSLSPSRNSSVSKAPYQRTGSLRMFRQHQLPIRSQSQSSSVRPLPKGASGQSGVSRDDSWETTSRYSGHGMMAVQTEPDANTEAGATEDGADNSRQSWMQRLSESRDALGLGGEHHGDDEGDHTVRRGSVARKPHFRESRIPEGTIGDLEDTAWREKRASSEGEADKAFI